MVRATHVIHVPTIGSLSHRAALEEIEQGTRAALEVATKLGATSVAFPLLGTGFAGLAAKPVAFIMLAVFQEFPELDITLCVHWQGNIEAATEAFERFAATSSTTTSE